MKEALTAAMVGWSAFLACNVALFYVAHLVVRRFFWERAAAVRWTAMGCLALAFILTVSRLLCYLALFRKLWVVLLAGMLAGVSHWFWAKRLSLRADLEPLRVWFESVAHSRGAVLLCAATVTTAIALRRGITQPPLFWDSLTYHMFLAARHVQSGGFSEFRGPFAMDHYSHFPANGELLASWFMLPFHSDLLVGLVTPGLLALGAAALYGLGRELGLAWDSASLAACLVCFSPFLFSFAISPTGDILVFAALISASLFGVRYVLRRERRDALLCFLAVGVAIGTKYTALALGGLWIAVLCVVAVRARGHQRNVRSLALVLAGGFLLVIWLGGQTYFRNWSETGNPIYPLEVVVAGKEIVPGSPYTPLIAAGGSPGTRAQDLQQFVEAFNYFPTWRIPTSAGPKFLFLFSLALLSAGAYRRPGIRSGVMLLLVGMAVTNLVAFYLPDAGFPALVRRVWPGSAYRFLPLPFSLLTVCAMPAFEARRERWPVLAGILASFILWDMAMADPTVGAGFPLRVGLLAVLGLAIALVLKSRIRVWRLAPWLAVAMVLLVGWLSVARVQTRRDASRWFHYANSSEVAWIPREYVEGWQYCDQPGKSLRIALAAGWERRGQNWFFYPLMGRHLQNLVTYVPIDDSRWPSPAAVNRTLDHGPISTDWVANLRRERIDLVFVQKPWPIEDDWMRENPQQFRLVRDGEAYKIYEFSPALTTDGPQRHPGSQPISETPRRNAAPGWRASHSSPCFAGALSKSI